MTLSHISSGTFHQLRVSHLHQLVFYTAGKNKQRNNGETLKKNKKLRISVKIQKFTVSMFLHFKTAVVELKTIFILKGVLNVEVIYESAPTTTERHANFKSKGFACNYRQQLTKYFKHEETNMLNKYRIY